ncbi:GGDEF domain protein [Halalkalibacter akibai JCM 9157]|uniref:GGDEF domain protein n=2 Tax=Halalkalibacter akibai TaxID=1411 RepID=W4QYI1_HALA3|nr:GGDEF domain protein [Halalkalibacter akibai JCM 9157]
MQTTASSFSNTLLQVEKLNSSLVSYQQSLENYGKNATESNRLHVLTKYHLLLEEVDLLNTIEITDDKDKERFDLFQTKISRIQEKMEVVIEERNSTVAIQLSSITNGVLNDVSLLSASIKKQYDILSKQNNQEIMYMFVLSGIVILILSSVSMYISTNKIVKPIKQLNAYSKQIAAGDFSIQELKSKSHDEIGELTQSFNTMKSSLFSLVGQLQQSADEQQILANTDELTKLFNRRYFMKLINQMEGKPFSVILFDIDSFKKINDTFGHLVGDKVIVHVATLLNNTMAGDVKCARFGGEEYIVLLPYVSEKDALFQAEQLRFMIEQSPVKVDDAFITVTCSFGVADSTGKANVLEVVHEADLALYAAKESGKNKVKSVV